MKMKIDNTLIYDLETGEMMSKDEVDKRDKQKNLDVVGEDDYDEEDGEDDDDDDSGDEEQKNDGGVT